MEIAIGAVADSHFQEIDFREYRRRSIDNVFKEIDWFKSKFPFEHIHIADELFGNDMAWVSAFCARIKPYGVTYLINTRLDRVNAHLEMLNMLKESGCTDILFGVEHISETILKSMQKKRHQHWLSLYLMNVYAEV